MVEGTQEQPLDAQFDHSLSFKCADEKSDQNVKISLQSSQTALSIVFVELMNSLIRCDHQ